MLRDYQHRDQESDSRKDNPEKHPDQKPSTVEINLRDKNS